MGVSVTFGGVSPLHRHHSVSEDNGFVPPSFDHNGNKCFHFLVPSVYCNVVTSMFYTTVCTLLY